MLYFHWKPLEMESSEFLSLLGGCGYEFEYKIGFNSREGLDFISITGSILNRIIGSWSSTLLVVLHSSCSDKPIELMNKDLQLMFVCYDLVEWVPENEVWFHTFPYIFKKHSRRQRDLKTTKLLMVSVAPRRLRLHITCCLKDVNRSCNDSSIII